MTERVELLLFGSPQVMKNGQLVRGFESRKAVALLCYLAARSTGIQPRQPIARVHLADLFWGDKTEAQGRSNLSHVLNNLKTVVPNIILADRNSIALAPEGFWLDLDAFEQDTAHGTLGALTAAAALYRDEFLAGLYLDDCPDFEVWLVAERERWHQRAVNVLEQVTSSYARGGNAARALPFAARVLDLEPWQDEAHRQMMSLLARTGQQSAALRQYETCRRVLAKELGVEPGTETTALYQQIRSEAIVPSAQVKPPHNLPTQLTSFIGRESDLARIAARLNNPDCRLLTLVGAGGIGKTRLAQEAAVLLLASFADGVFFVPLASISAGHAEFVVPAIANALGLAFLPLEEPKHQLLAHLAGKQLLLQLDNFEHVLEGRELVVEILQQASHVKIIVTSREPLNVQAEWLMRVTGLSFPTMGLQTTEDLLAYSALQLFVERASRVDDHFTLNEQTGALVLRICQSVEGMPLALELTAAALRTQRVLDIADKIGRDLDKMTPTAHDREARHSSLRVVMDWSYGLLTEAEQKLFQRLGVFAGGCTFEAAETMGAGQAVGAEQVFVLLSQLIDKSLVLVEKAGGSARYRMLEPIRQYALGKLEASAEAQRVKWHHAEYYLALAQRNKSPRRLQTGLGWFALIKPEHNNFRAALAWSQSVEGSAELGLWLAAVMMDFWGTPAYGDEGAQWLRTALAHANAERTEYMVARAHALYNLGFFLADRGDHAAAHSQLSKSLKLFEELRDLAMNAVVLGTLGWVARERGDMPTARARLQESLALHRELDNKREMSWDLVTLGEVLVLQEDADGAEVLLEEGLAIYHELKNPDIGWVLNHLGHVAQLQGKYARARQLHEESLPVFRQLGFESAGVIWCKESLGEIALAEGDTAAARQFFTEIQAQCWDWRNKTTLAWSLAGMAGVFAMEQEPARAARLWGAAEHLRLSIGTGQAPASRATREQLMAQARGQLGDEVFEEAWAAGGAAPLQQVLDETLASRAE